MLGTPRSGGPVVRQARCSNMRGLASPKTRRRSARSTSPKILPRSTPHGILNWDIQGFLGLMHRIFSAAGRRHPAFATDRRNFCEYWVFCPRHTALREWAVFLAVKPPASGFKVFLNPRLVRGSFIRTDAVPVMRGMSGPGVGCRARRRRREGEGPDDADRRARRDDCLRPAQTYPAAQERV